MANSKLATVEEIIALEQGTSKFGSAATISGASFTLPGNTGDVVCYPSAACHWHPTGTPTSSFGHAVRATEPFRIPAAKVSDAKIIGDAGAITMTVAYLRGSRRSDGKHAVARPY